jgi:chitinase
LPKIPAPTPLVETSPALPPAPNAILECGKFPDAMTVNFGYYQSWARYRSQGCNRVNPQDINVAENHYTHLTYAFAGIDTNDHLTPWGGDYVDEVPQYVAFNALKKTNPRLKTLISVGGWTFTDPGPTQTLFSDISASSTRRAAFAASVITFLQTVSINVAILY